MNVINSEVTDKLVIDMARRITAYNNYKCYNPHLYYDNITDIFLVAATANLLLKKQCLGLDCDDFTDADLTRVVQSLGVLP